jgi:hypothetical protein
MNISPDGECFVKRKATMKKEIDREFTSYFYYGWFVPYMISMKTYRSYYLHPCGHLCMEMWDIPDKGCCICTSVGWGKCRVCESWSTI